MGALLSLDELTALPDKTVAPQQMSLDDLAMLAPKGPPKAPEPAPAKPPIEAAPLSWGDAAKSAASNAPSSALQLAKNVVQPFIHPIDTATGLKNIGSGLISKAEGAVGVHQDPAEKAEREASANAVGQFFADRYGGMDNVKHTLATDPIGMAADLSAILTGGETVLARAPGLAGRAGEAAGTVGRAVDPIRAAGNAASAIGTRVVEPVVSHTLGLRTGVGALPIRTAARTGYAGNPAFVDALRGHTPQAAAVDMVQSALGQIRNERSQAYTAGMGAIRSDKTILDYTPINAAVQRIGDMVHFNGVVKSEDAANVYQKIADKVQEWQSQPARTVNTPNGPMTTLPHWTPEGFDALKQAVGEIRQGTQQGTLSRTIADNAYNAIKSEIVRQVPEYARIMRDYAEASDHMKDLSRTFSLGERAAPDTALRKLQSVMRNNVSTNYGSRTRLMDDLSRHEPNLLPVLAGHTMSSPTPRSLSALTPAMEGVAALATHNPAIAGAILTSSPRLVGEAAHAAGRGVAAIEHAANAVGINSDSIPSLLAIANQAGRASGGQ